MNPRITFITLGVDNLETSLLFYRDGLGLPTNGIVGTEFEYGAVVFFALQSGLTLALYPRRNLAKDSGLSLGPVSFPELSIGHNVASKDEVDAVMEQARRAGAVIIKEAQDTFGVVTLAIFKTPIGICGKSHGIHRCSLRNEAVLVGDTRSKRQSSGFELIEMALV